MAKKIRKEFIYAVYIVIAIATTMAGYYIGKKRGQSELYASAGLLVAAFVSVIMWVGWGKKHSY